MFPFRVCVVSEHPSGGGLTLMETDTQETKRQRKLFLCVNACVHICMHASWCMCERVLVREGEKGSVTEKMDNKL